MSNEANVAAVWEDLLAWLAQSWTVDAVAEESIDIRWRASDVVKTLKFGPTEWFDFVTDGSGEAFETPGWAFDELWEMLGSKRGPLVIRNGQLEEQALPSAPPSAPLSGRWSVVDRGGNRHHYDFWEEPPNPAGNDHE